MHMLHLLDSISSTLSALIIYTQDIGKASACWDGDGGCPAEVVLPFGSLLVLAFCQWRQPSGRQKPTHTDFPHLAQPDVRSGAGYKIRDMSCKWLSCNTLQLLSSELQEGY